MNTAQILDYWNNDAKKFEKKGGDMALFWAGKLSVAASQLISSRLIDVSDRVHILNYARRKYDDVIINRT